MTKLGVLPAGVRLDHWPEAAPELPEYSPEIVKLREELRQCVPQLADQLDTFESMRQIRQLLGSAAGPRQVTLVTERT